MLPWAKALTTSSGAHVVGPQALRIDGDDHRPLIAAEGRRGGDARQAGEHRPHPHQGQVLDFANTAGLAGEDEVAHRHAARIEAHHEGRYRVRRHEGPGTIDVADRFRHRLGHVRARMKVQLHQGKALYVPGLDVIDAGNVQKMIFVIVRQKTFHLRRVHAAIRLADIDHRQIKAGKDIDGHPHESPGQQPRPIATSAITTVMGRRSAKRMRFIG